MRFRVTKELQPEFLDLLRSLDLDCQYAFVIMKDNYTPDSLYILLKCTAISRTDLELLLPWGTFIVCPHNDVTLALYTSLPADIETCII